MNQNTEKQCPNYEICCNTLSMGSTEMLQTVCEDCMQTFGRWLNNNGVLTFKDNITCSRCSHENNRGIALINCDHYLCNVCLKESNRKLECILPPFPLAHIEDIYYKSSLEVQEIFLDEYPMIRAFVEYYAKLIESRAIMNNSRPRIRCYECESHEHGSAVRENHMWNDSDEESDNSSSNEK